MTANSMVHNNGASPPAADTDTVNWEAVYWQQIPRLYNYFRYRTGEETTAQDLTSKTLERAWRYRERYHRDLGAFEAWLFQIARRVVADYLQILQQYPPDLALDDLIEFPSTESLSVEQEIEQRQDAAHLYQLLQRLSERDQELIALKYGADMTNRAIAQVTGLSESNVGTILHRLIQKLRVEWGWGYTYER